ncbi:hypothetical protein AMTRI_Chr04g182530 [Amborella trichopoda]
MEAKKGALLPHPPRLIPILSFTAVMCFFDFLEGSPFCRENERVALLDFKASNSNPNGLNCCEWEGVECHSSSCSGTSNGVSLRVDTIPWKDSIEKAPFMSFTKEGKPPIAMNVKNAATNMSMDSVMLNASSLTRLSQLQHLQLRFFAGVLPIKELSKLKNLRELILVSNEFSGGIPEEVGLLSSLKKLDLRNHHQGPIPASIGGLTFLAELDLSYNDLNGRILEEVGLLSSLQKLYLDGNRLQGRIPSTLGNLSRLNVLQLYGNQLSCSIPESLGSLLSLEPLDVGENKLEGSIPSTLNNLSRLNVLQLYGNQLSGSILESLGSLLSLESLDLHENKLEGSIPSTLGNLSRLNVLQLYGNQLSGNIPSTLGNLSLLNDLLLYGNQLSGSIPESLGSLLSLEWLDHGENKLEGSIPFSIANLSSLEILVLSENHLQGSIPRELGKLYSLSGLLLNDNDLSGDFSFTVFANVSSLKYVHLSANPKLTISHNNFTPAFQLYSHKFSPGFLSTQNQLFTVDLSKSNIVGNIPSWLLEKTGELLLDGNLLTGVQFLPNISYNLNNLDISNNPISRNFPRNFSSYFPNLQSLKMSQNFLNDDLMFYIIGFKRLRMLDLSSNNISGNLPSIFPYNLIILDLSNNKITGEIPPNLTRGHDLMFLSLSKNSLNGPLQSKHFKLPNLVSLHLDNNAFNGTIPRNLLQCSPSLTVLNLANNKLYAPMPIELFGLLELKVLILRGNFFDHIPLKLCQVKSLAVLDFSQNNLEGPVPPCFNNFSAWTNASFIGSFSSRFDPFLTFSSKFWKVEFTKGNTYSYLGDALKNMTGLDLSENKLSGPTPLDMGLLKELAMLNLSNNLLTGPIPKSFGGLLGLSTLNLSYNALSGEFPSQLTRLTHLSIFSVANNNLSGEIPDTTQFCTFNESSFSGNPNLNTQGKRCSTTLSSNVPTASSDNDGEDEDEDEGDEGWVEMTPAFYAFIALGYAIGIWGALAHVFFGNKRGHACVRAMDAIVSRLFHAFFRKH